MANKLGGWLYQFTKKHMYCFVFLLLILVFALGGWNFVKYDNFFQASFVNIITLITAILLAFMFSQMRNQENKLKEKAEGILDKIQSKVQSENFYSIKKDCYDKKKILMTLRSIANHIEILTKYASELNFSEDVVYINEEFLHYKDLISNHLEDLEHLTKAEPDLMKFANNIDSKCDHIRVSLYIAKK